MKDFKTLLDTDSTIVVAKKEFETTKQLWEKQLREIQSRQQASQKMTQKSQSKSPGGKPKDVKKPPQARDKKGTKEGTKDGSKQLPKMQQSTAGNGGLQSDARTSTSGTGEGESLLSAAKTTYFKDKKAESDSGVQRKRVHPAAGLLPAPRGFRYRGPGAAAQAHAAGEGAGRWTRA